jgi:mannose-1-phosphate guanylyltransferase
MKHFYALIMAGGGGTRLWPMSRKELPKQLLPLIDENSMFHTSVARLAPVFSSEQIYVVTGRKYVEAMRQDVAQIPAENFLAEPYGRDNAAAVGLALTTIYQRDPEAVIAILTADHHIGKPDVFCRVLTTAYEVAQQGFIVTLGISPSFPSTGFGYIQQGEKLGEQNGFGFYKATRFTEKPDVVLATKFISSGRYSWNSGMFIMSVKQALDEFERQQPEMHSLLNTLAPAVDTPEYEVTLARIWETMPKKSIDYAIMEGAERMAIIPVDIGWSDVGTWASLYDILPQDKFGNCAKGKAVDNRIVLDTHNTLIFGDKLTVTIGVEDLVIVQTDDVILVCHKDRTQDIKQVVDYLNQHGNTDYL